MAIKNVETIRTNIENAIKAAQPNITTRVGSAVRDVFINPQAQQLAFLYTEVDNVSKAQSPLEAVGDDLIALAENWHVYRRGAIKATGLVTFYTYTEPDTDISIPSGTWVETLPDTSGNIYRFQTVQSVTMYLSAIEFYHNSETGRYEITAYAEAEQGGSSYNIGAYSIKKLSSPITGINGATNNNAFIGGADEESYTSLRSRLIAKMTGTNIGTLDGYYEAATLYNGVQDAKVIGPRDSEMLRKSAGGVDVFIKGTVASEVTETFTPSSTTAPDIVVTYQPVITTAEGTLISSELGVMTYGVDWEWERDTSVLSYSTQGLDKIHWLVDKNNVGTLTITYMYNRLISDLQTYFNGDSQRLACADVLVRWATPVYIDVSFTVVAQTGYDADTVEANAESAVETLLGNYILGEEVQKSDVIEAINSAEGVDDVDSTTLSLTDQEGEISPDSYGNIDIPANRYAYPGNIVATVIT